MIVHWTFLKTQGRWLLQSERQLQTWLIGLTVFHAEMHHKPHRIKMHHKNCRTDSLQLRKREPIMWKHSRKSSNSSYISLKLYSFIWRKTLLQRLYHIGFCCFYHHLIDIVYVWAGNALQVHKANKQIILLKLQGMVFTVFTKENI